MKTPFIALLCLACFAAAGCAGPKIQKAVAAEQAKCKTEMTKALAPVQSELTQVKADKTDLEAKKSDLEAQAKAAQERIDSLTQSNQQLSDTLAGSKNQSAKSTDEAKKRIQELVAQKDELSQKLADVQKAKISADRRRANTEAKLMASQAAKADLDEKLGVLEAAKAKTKTEREAREAKVKEAAESLSGLMPTETQKGYSTIERADDSFVVTLQESLLFDPNTAKINDEGAVRLDKLGAAIAKLDAFDLRVEGHTDNAPLKKQILTLGGFSNRWELGAARAVAVARYLAEKSGVDARRIAAATRAEFKPRQANDTAEGRQANRRVDLVFSLPAGEAPAAAAAPAAEPPVDETPASDIPDTEMR